MSRHVCATATIRRYLNLIGVVFCDYPQRSTLILFAQGGRLPIEPVGQVFCVPNLFIRNLNTAIIEFTIYMGLLKKYHHVS